MGDRQSLDQYLQILSSVVEDVYLLCGLSLKESRYDIKTLTERTRCEGLGFLTKALPKLGKAFDRSLETRSLEVPVGFRTNRNSKTPVFLRGVFRTLYSEDGLLLVGSGVVTPFQLAAVAGIRQICYQFYKLETDYHPTTVARVLDSFVAVDDQLPLEVEASAVSILDASQLLEELLDGIDLRNIVPRHGPGAVACGEFGPEKYNFDCKFPALVKQFPMWDYFMVGASRELLDRLDWYKSLKVIQPMARVTLVPKDSRGPRIISMEPKEIQWIQQGVRASMYDHVEKHPLTRGHVLFTDQSIHRSLAQTSSLSREFATLDMKDASDRVSWALVRAIFPDCVVSVLDACRSTSTRLPDGRIVKLNKFAPMGSAVCFPVEALVFWALAVSACTRFRHGKNFHRFDTRLVYVYGDDIIVPVDCVDSVVSVFEEFSLLVNRDKSFSQGYFRESCGGDFYCGEDVTVVRQKCMPDNFKRPVQSASLYDNLCAVANGLFNRGYWRGSKSTWALAQEIFGPIPACAENSAYTGVVLGDFKDVHRYNRRISVKSRWSKRYQRVEYFVRVTDVIRRPLPLDGWSRLLCSLNQGSLEADLPRWALHKRTRLICKWSSP